MQMTNNFLEIKNLMPHRYPFFFIDRLISCEPGKSLTALKNVSANEDYFNGHFPQRPVMPGVLQLEALAQASGLLIFYTTKLPYDEKTNWYYFAGIDHVRFKRIVEPGDQLILKVEVVNIKRDIWFFKTQASVADEIACSAELMLAKGALK